MAASMNMTVIWDLAPCSRPDGDSKHLRNVGKLLSGYTALDPSRQLPKKSCFQEFHQKAFKQGLPSHFATVP
jgi:hypothetical protein